MINQYAGDAPTLRLLCSITGGTNKAQWEDVTGSTPLTFVNDCVSFTTTVSARFWLMDCRQVSEATKFATELYAEAMHVPFMAKFVVFAKRQDPMEAQLRVFCMTDDKEDKTLESQEHFTEVAKSRDVEVLEKKSQYLEFGGNLVPVTKSGEQLQLQFQAFRENRLPFAVRVKDPHQEPLGRLAFMRQPRAARATEPPQAPLCNLNIALPEYEASQNLSELVTLEKKYGFVEETGLAKPELIHRADLRLSDIARELGSDWPALAAQLDVPEQDVASIRTECPSDLAQQALLMLRLWMKRAGGRATGNNLEKGLRMINREDIVNKCMFNVELVTDDVEKAVAKVHLDQSGFDTFREELGTPKDTSLKRDASLDVSYDEQDLMKAESAEETSSETGSVHEKHTGSEAKGTSKAIPGVRKGSPISAAIGRIVRGSSKEKAAPRMAVEETFEEEPVLKIDSAEVTQQAAPEAGPTAPPRDSKKKSKKEKSPSPLGPDYSLPRMRDYHTPERDFTSTTDTLIVSSIKEDVDASKELATDGKVKKEKKKEKKEKSPSPPGPDYTLPRLRDTYTPPSDVTAAGYAASTLPGQGITLEQGIVKEPLERKSKERSLSPGVVKTGENGSLGADPSVERQVKQLSQGPEDTIYEKVERVVKETPGKIVEMVHIKRQRSSKSPEGRGSPKDKNKGLPSSEVVAPDISGESRSVPSETIGAEKKQKKHKETSPTKQGKKEAKEVSEAVDKDAELSASDGKLPDSGFLSKMAKLPKKMFPRSGKASASDEEPSSLSESSPVAKKKAGKLPKSATLPKAKPSKTPLYEIKSVDVEVDTSKLTSKGVKGVPAKDGEGLETSRDKEPDSRFFSKMARIPKKMFPRSSKTSSSEDEPSSASENLPSSKQRAKKEKEISSKKKEKVVKVKPDSKKLSTSFEVEVDRDTLPGAGVDINAKKPGLQESLESESRKKTDSMQISFPQSVKAVGSKGEPMEYSLDIEGMKSLQKEPQLAVVGEFPGKPSPDIELSLTSKETAPEFSDKARGHIEIGTPEHGKSSKGGFMTKMAKLPRKMFPHGFKGDVSVEEPSVEAESVHVSVPEAQVKLGTKDLKKKGPDMPAMELTASLPVGAEGSVEMSAPDLPVSADGGLISKVTQFPKMFSHDSQDGVTIERPPVVGEGIDVESSLPDVQLKVKGKAFEKPETKFDVTLPERKVTPVLPDGAEGHIEVNLDEMGKSYDDGFMSKMAKLPKKMFSHGLEDEIAVQEPSITQHDIHVDIPKLKDELEIRATLPEKPQVDFDVAIPGKQVSLDLPEGVESKIEVSAPDVGKPTDGGFMSKVVQLPKKMFPHGSKGTVPLEEAPEAVGDIHAKVPEAHLKVGLKGLEKPDFEGDIAVPGKKGAVSLPEGTEGKIEVSTPETGKPSDKGFMSKMAKLPKKMFPHGSKGSVSVEEVPEVDRSVKVKVPQGKIPEAHLKVDIKDPEKHKDVDIALSEEKVDIDLPEGIDKNIEVTMPEVSKPSEGGFISKMAKFPKKMFPHGAKGSVSVEEAPGIDVDVKMPETRISMDVKGLEKPKGEVDISLPKEKVDIDVPKGFDGKLEMSAPEVGKPSEGGFMSKMAKFPKKMFPHGAKGSVSVEEAPGIDVDVKVPEAHISMDVKGLEKPRGEVDISLPKEKVDIDVPKGFDGKLEMSAPEVGKPSEGGFMSKMAKFPKKMFPHGAKGSLSVEETPGIDVDVKMPEADLSMDVKGLEKPKAELDIAMPKGKIDIDMPEGVDGKLEASAPDIGKPSDGGFISKMTKFPKKMFPHGAKGTVSVEAPELGDVQVNMPEAHLGVDIKGPEKPKGELDVTLPKGKVDIDLPEGIEGKVEISAPEIGKPDGGFMSKMAKLPKKMFPHGAKGGVSVEGSPELGDVEVKMPEAHLGVDIKGPEKPKGELDVTLPKGKVDIDLPEGIEGKVEISAPEIGKPDGGFMSKMAKLPKKMFSHGAKGGVSVEGSPELGDVQVKMPEAHLGVDIKGPEKPKGELDVTLPKGKVDIDLPEGIEGKVEISSPEIGKPDGGFMSKMAKLPKKMFPHGAKGGVSVEGAPELGDVEVKMPEAHLGVDIKGPEKPKGELDVTLPKGKVDIDLPEGIEGKVEISAPEIGKPDGGFMSKMAKLPKKMFPHGAKGGVSVEGAPELGDVEVKMPEAHLGVDIKGPEKPKGELDVTLPKGKVDIDLPEGFEGKVEISAPEIGKPDGGFMSKMAKLPKKMFPHGTKGGVSVEGAPELGDVEVKMPEAHLGVDIKGPEKPKGELDVTLPKGKVDIDLPEGIEGKVEISSPEIGKPDGGFMSKMAKLPKKMFPHGAKGGVSVEGAPELGDVEVKMPEAHLGVDIKGPEKPKGELDVTLPKGKVDIDLPEGIEGKVEISAPEIGKPDGGFMSKMAKLPKKMFPHGAKGGVSVEGSPELGDVEVKMPEAHLGVDIKGPEKPKGELDVTLPKGKVDIDLPEGIEGKLEISAPEIGKPDGGFMSKMAKFPKKMFPHGAKGGVSVEGAPELGDVQVKMPEAHLGVDIKGPEKPKGELDVTLPKGKVDIDLPEGIEGKVEISAPEIGKPDGGFMSKMAKFPKKMFPHGAKGGVSVEGAPELGDVQVKMPEAHLGVDIEGPEKPKGELDVTLPKGKVDIDLPEGIEGKVEISAPEIGKPDGGFMSKMAKFPKKMFPHGTKGGVSVEGAPELGDVEVKMPEAHLGVDIKGPEKPKGELDVTLPKGKVDIDLPEGIEGKVEISAPEIGKPDGGFMSKMAKLPQKMFPHGTKGGVSVEGAPELGDIQLKMPEAHLGVDIKGPEKPKGELDAMLPKGKVDIDLPEGIEGKVEISAPEIGKPDGGFMSKMAKLPKKMFSHGAKGSISVEGSPEFGDVEVKMPEAHLGGDIKGPEKPKGELDVALPKGKVDIDIPEGIEGKVEISAPEIGKPSDGGFVSKMAKLPKKMFPHGTKGSVSIEGAPEVGDVQVKVPEAQLKMDIKGTGKPEFEGEITWTGKKVAVELPEGIEGTVEMSTPEMGRPSDGGFMSKVAKLPKKVFSHGSKGGVPFDEETGVAGDIEVKMSEAALKVDVKYPEKPESDFSALEKKIDIDVPEGFKGKVEISTPELGKPSDGGFLSKMSKLPKKVLPHGSKGEISAGEVSEVSGEVPVELPEARLKVGVKGPERPDSDVDISVSDKKVTLDVTKGFEGKVEVSTPDLGKPSDKGFISKVTKFPKKMFPHGSKGGVSVGEVSEVTGDVHVELPDAHLKVGVKGPERPDSDVDVSMAVKKITVDVPEGFEGKLEVSTPELARSPDGSLVSKAAKLPKKLVPSGENSLSSVEEPSLSAHVDVPGSDTTFKVDAKLPAMPVTDVDISLSAKESSADIPVGVAGKVEIGTPDAGKPSDKGFMSKMAKIPKKMFHHGPKSSGSTDEHSTVAETVDDKALGFEVQLQKDVKIPTKPEADVSVSFHEKEVTVQLPEGREGTVELSTPGLVGEHVPDKSSQGADVLLPGKELPTVEGQEIIEKPGGVIEVIEVTAHELSKPLSSGLLSKVSKIPKKIFPRGSKSKSSDEDSPSPGKRELKETPGGIVEVVEVTKHDVAIHPESTHVKQVGTEVLLEPATSETKPSGAEGLPPTHITREIKEVPGGIVEVVRVTKHIVGKLPEDKGIGEPSVRTTDASLPWEAELAKDPSAVIKREVKETPEGHVEVVQVIRREASDVPFGSDFPGDLESDGTVSRRIETTVVDGKPTVIRRLVTTTSDGIRQVTEHIEQGAEDAGSAASSLFAKMGEFAKGLSSDDPSAVTTREVKQLPGGAVEVVSVTKRSSSSPETEITSQEQLQSSTSGSMHFAESAVGKPMEAKTTIIRREISGPETIVRTTTSVVTSATAPGSSKPELSADVLDKMFGAMEKPRVDDRLRDVLTAEGGYVAKREVTPEEAELLAQLFPEQSTGVAVYPPAGLVPEAAIIPEYRCMTTAEGAHHDPESKEKVLLKLGRALSQDDLDAPSPTQGEAAMTVAGLGEAVDTSDQVEEPAVEKLELARRESKRYSQEFEQDEPLPKAMGFKTKPSEETVVSSTQVKGVHDNGTVKHTVTTVTKTTIIQEVEEPAGAPRPGESETWASDLDTSQVSVSSLPEDERTEPTLSSSATTATADAEALSGPLARTQVEEKVCCATEFFLFIFCVVLTPPFLFVDGFTASKKQKKRGKKRSKN
ncbi:hypothetical protein V5799_030638 [Amblyomma americanum]|uniref:Death domain-containing protein n=1 Tax=Amblyomma americanum TaxID=6943 RepID=A0AAQ4EMM8_AMBAM